MRLNEDFPERLASAAYETLKKAYTDAQENLQAFLDDLQYLYARFTIKQVNTNNHTIMLNLETNLEILHLLCIFHKDY